MQFIETASSSVPQASESTAYSTSRGVVGRDQDAAATRTSGLFQRVLVAMLLCLGIVSVSAETADAQFLKIVTGYLPAGRTLVFFPRDSTNSAKDTIYQISGTLSISGRLEIRENAEVQFLPNSRIIDSTGGKIIADASCTSSGLQRRIKFKGQPVNQNSVEWGHILILPGADSAYFNNVSFTNIRKGITVDNKLVYGAAPVANATYSTSVTNQSNGVGACICTFSQKTWIIDVSVDNCQAMYRGGAFAFLQAPAAPAGSGFDIPAIAGDDGRLALNRGQVRRLLIRDTRVFNTSGADANTGGGAIYMASRPGATSASHVTAFLGHRPGNCTTSSDTNDVMIFERCTSNNPNTGAAQMSWGGAIYAGSQTSLVLNMVTFNDNEAISLAADANSRGGAIYVSSTSGNPTFSNPPAFNLSDPPYGLAIYKRAAFNTNRAGRGGAIYLEAGATASTAPSLNIDAENKQSLSQVNPLRDSGLIAFNGNMAFLDGGAICTQYYTYITGYLAPSTGVLNQPDFRQLEFRVKFTNNVAGRAGGSIYMSPTGSSSFTNADIVSRRVWHLNNSVNPADPRIAGRLTQFQVGEILGGGAEYIGGRDSTFSTEYHGNFTIGGNGGAVNITDPINTGNPFNRYFVEDKYNALNVTISPSTFDPRELTRFCDNHAYLGPDSNASNVMMDTKGRGGALYVHIDNQNNPNIALDSVFLSRVRMEMNYAFTGAAIHSDNYGLNVLANLTLIANNHATSQVVATADVDNQGANPADLRAGATIWADFEGPLPSYESNSRGNAIYDNTARYLLRLPNGPAGSGFGGTDTVRGNFWGETGPDLVTILPLGGLQRTFFIDYYKAGCFANIYEPNRPQPSGSYVPVPVGTIPDTLLMEGRVYDIFDRGTDIKTADYSTRRMAPAESFALGLPTDLGLPNSDITKDHRGLHRFTRDIFSTDPTYLDKIMTYQTDFVGPHPIGYPLFLQADVDANDINQDDCARNYTTLFVVNFTTNEFVRVNAKEVTQNGRTTFKGRLDFVPDSSIASRNAFGRSRVNWTLSQLRPLVNTFAEIQRASKLEDSAALDGRLYSLDASQYNAGAADNVCVEGITGTNTWYAGERYRTLPVRPGDDIAVISRTQLWKYGAFGALSRGLRFTIGDVLAPGFTSDIVTLQNDPINPNRRFLREDENYDNRDPQHILFRIAGYDPNAFYDPRYLFDVSNYTQLQIEWNRQGTPADTRLWWWLNADTLRHQNVTGSNGYVQLKGWPHNPDVVPGGEEVAVRLTNFPPNFNSQTGLVGGGFNLGADPNRLSMWAFPPYFNCPTGFQTDTLCVRSTSSDYRFRIFVQDSLPRFTSSPNLSCAANLTDKLRYDYDIQTDDESEDSLAATQGWDFRYGRTSYSFLTRPMWLQTDANGFRSQGKISVRIPAVDALPLITPIPQVNGELNLDTLIAIQADDGHTGISVQKWRIPVNVEPSILTTSLPDAKEDQDYSFDFHFVDSVRKIQITDPNFNDAHTFRLLRKGQTEVIYRDSKYKEGDSVTLTGGTPDWLQIDPYSGVLFGTPGAQDAPHGTTPNCGAADTVTIIVTDQCGLTAWKQLPLNVDSTNHSPFFSRGPRTLCVTNATNFCDSVDVTDRDLKRITCTDQLNITVIDPTSNATITVTPNPVNGNNETVRLAICGQFNEDAAYFNQNPLPERYIALQVRDNAGNIDTVRYRVYIGDRPTFQCAVSVSNIGTSTHPTDIQTLCFGAGHFGTDGLDTRYCEFEIPPPGPSAVFDARWELPIGGQIKGTYIDIRRDTAASSMVAWQVRFNAGNEGGSFLYPLRICWNTACLENVNQTTMKGRFYLVNPFDAREFTIDMGNGLGPINTSAYSLARMGADSLCLVIRNVGLTNARIVFVPNALDVKPTTPMATEFALEQNFPNPFNPSTTVNFTVAKPSDVRVEVYDMKGSLIKTLVNEHLSAGSYPVTWDATDANGAAMPSGTYVCKMTAGDFTSSIKMQLKK